MTGIRGWCLLLKRLADLICRGADGVARGIGPIAKTLADRIGTTAEGAMPQIGAGVVEILLRPVSTGVAGAQAQKSGKSQKKRRYANHVRIMPPSR